MIRAAITATVEVKRPCKICKTPFAKRSMSHVACSPVCAAQVAQIKRLKAESKALLVERRDDRARKEVLKSRADWLREAQTAVNAFVRQRDALLPCISCGRHHDGQYHAGHYLSRGARPELRFNLDNINKQCAPCNNHLSGNSVLYRVALVRKIGMDRVEALEGPQPAVKYTIDDAKDIKALFRAKTKTLQSNNREVS